MIIPKSVNFYTTFNINVAQEISQTYKYILHKYSAKMLLECENAAHCICNAENHTVGSGHEKILFSKIIANRIKIIFFSFLSCVKIDLIKKSQYFQLQNKENCCFLKQPFSFI